MATIYIVEFDLYTDHEYGYGRHLFKNHVSRWFENDLYEYTQDCDGYGDMYRRVFDSESAAIEFMTNFMNTIHSSDEDIVNELHDRITKGVARFMEGGNGFIVMPNNGGSIHLTKTETDARPIKHIIFEGDDYKYEHGRGG